MRWSVTKMNRPIPSDLTYFCLPHWGTQSDWSRASSKCRALNLNLFLTNRCRFERLCCQKERIHQQDNATVKLGGNVFFLCCCLLFIPPAYIYCVFLQKYLRLQVGYSFTTQYSNNGIKSCWRTRYVTCFFNHTRRLLFWNVYRMTVHFGSSWPWNAHEIFFFLILELLERVLLRLGCADTDEQLGKKGIVRFLCGGIFPELEILSLLIVASADTRFSVATPAIVELNKICS